MAVTTLADELPATKFAVEISKIVPEGLVLRSKVTVMLFVEKMKSVRTGETVRV